jgi:asparagine synthase (glutamine-hydrolysing)
MLLPPGYVLSSTACEPFAASIRNPDTAHSPGSARALDELLCEAVRIRLPPDLPVATMFSGGIDSTLITHYARRFRPEAPGYFVGGPDAPDYPYAAAYADNSGLDLRLVPLDAGSDEVFGRIGEIVATTEAFEPNLIRVAACSLAVAAQMHRDGFQVALCGEGADELFCGYPPLELAFLDGEAAGRPLREECLDLMHRVSLQRVDRCAMRYQIEARQPFLDPAVAGYALGLDAGALVRETNGLPVGKAALRDLYDLYPDQLPAAIRDRSKVPMAKGAGLDVSAADSAWKTRFEEAISDRDLSDGRAEFAVFNIQSKEELYYLRKLSEVMDVFRVPHLYSRAWISFPVARYADKLKQFAHFSL